MENLDNALALGKGVIIVGAHLGNFSVVARTGAARGYKISIVAEDIKPPKLYDYVNKLRGHFGLEIIKLHSAQVRTIYHLLRNNEVLALAVDRDVTGDGIPTMCSSTRLPPSRRARWRSRCAPGPRLSPGVSSVYPITPRSSPWTSRWRWCAQATATST